MLPPVVRSPLPEEWRECTGIGKRRQSRQEWLRLGEVAPGVSDRLIWRHSSPFVKRVNTTYCVSLLGQSQHIDKVADSVTSRKSGGNTSECPEFGKTLRISYPCVDAGASGKRSLLEAG